MKKTFSLQNSSKIEQLSSVNIQNFTTLNMHILLDSSTVLQFEANLSPKPHPSKINKKCLMYSKENREHYRRFKKLFLLLHMQLSFIDLMCIFSDQTYFQMPRHHANGEGPQSRFPYSMSPCKGNIGLRQLSQDPYWDLVQGPVNIGRLIDLMNDLFIYLFTIGLID